ncbi:hypothetical protein JAAARDRAFT_139800 [Jaapia argillacea MUCL 33604]|uniref:CHAT domain-containing protein n=1 Tax=Jaapia argillacea MUCL 33604 TaxID=933084 RepID=A0A067PL43_9AGAM|nr:hypothetical protein JAAARDRAFT_139800 [Jaapia argillacea MUCL 33604]
MLSSISDSNFVGRENNLGLALKERFEMLGNLVDLEAAIIHQLHAVKNTFEDDKTMPSLLTNLGNMFQSKFRRLGNLADLNAAIVNKTKAVQLTSDGDLDKPGRLNNLGVSLQSRFEIQGDIDDIQNAILLKSQAVDLTLNENSEKPSFYNSLGNALLIRFQSLGAIADLDTAIENQVMSINTTQDGNHKKPSFLSSLGSTYLIKFGQLGNIEDLNNAILYILSAVNLESNEHINKPVFLSNLGSALQSRFDRFGDLADLESAIGYLSTAVDLAPDQQLDKPLWISNLGSAYQRRYERLGNICDLNMAISNQSTAVDSVAETYSQKGTMLNELGECFLRRFERLGEIVDVDAAVRYKSHAIDSIEDGHPDKPLMLNSLGNTQRARFIRLGNHIDISVAIQNQLDALHKLPNEHAERSTLLSSLGNSFQSRYTKLQDIDDLNTAILYKTQAVNLTPDDHSDKAGRLSNLGIALHCRFNIEKKEEDIDAAIVHHSAAVTLIPDDNPYKPMLLSNLASTLCSKFEINKDSLQIDEAIRNQLKAVQLISSGHPTRAAMCFNLGDAYYKKCEVRLDINDMITASHWYSTAALSPTGSPNVLYRSAIKWMNLAYYTPSIVVQSTLIEACSTALNLLPSVAWIGHELSHQLDELKDLPLVSSDAAACAIKVGDYQLAVRWLEQGRLLVWKQMLHLRYSASELESQYPNLAKQFREVSQQLEWYRAERALDNTHKSAEMLTQDYRAAAIKWEKLLSNIRSLPNFEDFLTVPSFSKLILAANNGPIVIPIASQYQCDALIIIPNSSTIKHIPLPLIKFQRVQDLHVLLSDKSDVQSDTTKSYRHFRPSIARSSDPLKECLSQLWHYVVKPILLELELLVGFYLVYPEIYTNKPLKGLSKLIHMWWCPTGPFIGLPFHAAGVYDQSSSISIMDSVISSYTTSLEGLIESQNKTNLSVPFEILAIGQAQTPHFPYLPGTTKEVAIIKQLAPPPLGRFLEGSAATIEQSLKYLDHACWCHFACHGTQNVVSPLKSAFQLQDGPLYLSDIIQRNLKHAEFAFLSACETAKGDSNLYDEATHLAGGLLLAGFKSIIATLWSIQDNDGPVISESVYTYLLSGGKYPDGSKAAEALHYSVLDLRQRGLSLERWVPFIHIGC